MKYDHLYRTDLVKNNLKRYAIQGAAATVFTRAIVSVSKIFGSIILARLLAPEDFGLVTMVTVFSDILLQFGSLKLSEAIIQKEEITHNQVSTLFWINVVLSFFIAFIFILLSPAFVFFYKEPRLNNIVIAVSVAIFFNGFSLQHLALMQRNMLFNKIAILQVAVVIVTDIISIIMAWNGFGYWAIVARRMGFPLLMTFGAWISFDWRPGLFVRGSGVRPMIKFGMNSLAGYSVSYFSRSLDKLLIGWRYGSIQLGFYDRAFFLFMLPVNQLTAPLTNVAVATLSRLTGTPDIYRSYYYKSLFMISFVGMPVSAFLTIAGKDFLTLVLGPQWHLAGDMFTVLSPGIGVMLIYATHGWLHLSLGRAERWFRWEIIGALLFGTFFFVGIQFGPIFVAGAFSFSFYILLLPALWYAGKPINIDIYKVISEIYRPFLSSFIAGIIVFILIENINFSPHNITDITKAFNLFITFIMFISAYLMLTILFYRGVHPILEFKSIIKDNLLKK
jgi:PST family polysaccharide transporter